MELSENGLSVRLIMVDSCKIMLPLNLILELGMWLSDGALACRAQGLGSPPQHQKEKGKNILAHAKAACPG